jgi:hypothetical protein
MTERVIRIGGASGAWGDSPMAIGQLLREGVDYLIMDYLAEVTMSLLARAKKKNPEAGYPPDFVAYLEPHLKTIRDGNVRVVTNAGGMNPAACKKSIEALAEKAGVSLRVAMVEGDDVMPLIPKLRAAGIPDPLLSANAYLGALPILTALERGADIVITGRSVDSALVLAILMHEFHWQATDYNLLAAGSLAGHLLECGPQVTGGIFTDWEEVPDWHNIGYPIAECRADGTFVVIKPKGTGGLVSPAAVAEQVLYEIGDPARYLLPDVTADFSMVQLKPAGPDRVMVSGASGQPPTAQYKVSATYQDGFRAVAVLVIIGVQAARKAERTARALIARSRMLFEEQRLPDFASTHIEALGAEASYGAESKARETREVVLRLVVDHPDARALDIFARQAGAVGISFAQGTAGLIGGRPNTTPLIRLFTFFVDKSSLPPPRVTVACDEPVQVQIPIEQSKIQNSRIQNEEPPMEDTGEEEFEEVPLLQVAHARSGDKGDSSNIAIFCRRPEYMPCLRTQLTVERIAAHFVEVADGPVERFEAPGLAAFNFVIQNALGGGGMASPRIDPQGKSYGQRSLEMKVRVPRRWVTGGPYPL